MQLFISRAGADGSLALTIARIFLDAGHDVVVQDWDFPNQSFMHRIHEALHADRRVIALLSPEYLRSDYCEAEWQATIAKDPLNRRERLILFRVAECEPGGLLASLWYWDLIPVLANRDLLRDVVLASLQERSMRKDTTIAGPYWREPRTISDVNAIAATATFTGRDKELAAITERLWEGDRPLVLCGLGGVGKTSLAREYARKTIDRYSIIWHLGARTESEVLEHLGRLGARLIPGLADVTDLPELARHIVTEVIPSRHKPALLIFDNLENENILTAWMPRNAHVLVTTRVSTWSDAVSIVALHTFAPNDAAEYLRRNSGRNDLIPADAIRIVDSLGALPLALAHASGYLRAARTVSPTRYLERLDFHMQHIPKGVASERSVYATFSEAILNAELNEPGAAALMCLMSFLGARAIPRRILEVTQPPAIGAIRPELPTDVALVLGDVLGDRDRLDQALAELDRFSLVEFDPVDATLDVHLLVQQASREMLCQEDFDSWAIAAVVTVNRSFPTPHFENWPECEELLPHSLAALALLPPHLGFNEAGRLCNQSAYYLEERALFVDAEVLYRRSLAIAWATERSGGKPATALNNLAWLLSRQARYAEAEPMLREAIMRIEKGDESADDLPYILNNLAVILRELGRDTESAEIYKRAADLAEAFSRTPSDQSALMSNQGRLALETGFLDVAADYFERALTLSRHDHGDDHPSVALVLENIGDLELQRGNHRESEAAFRKALRILEGCLGPQHPDIAVCLARMAVAVQAIRPAEAEPLYRRALAILEPYGDPHIQTRITIYGNLGTLLAARGSHADADAMFGNALAALSQVGKGDSDNAAIVHANRAMMLVRLSRFEEAEGALRDALRRFERTSPNSHDVVRVLEMLGHLFGKMGKMNEAQQVFDRAKRVRSQ